MWLDFGMPLETRCIPTSPRCIRAVGLELTVRLSQAAGLCIHKVRRQRTSGGAFSSWNNSAGKEWGLSLSCHVIVSKNISYNSLKSVAVSISHNGFIASKVLFPLGRQLSVSLHLSKKLPQYGSTVSTSQSSK